MYNPAVGRWNGVDALAEKYYSQSSYHFSGNNPIKFIDWNGMNYGHYVDEAGNYLGEDANTDDNTVYVTTQKTWDEVGGEEGAKTEEGTTTLQTEGNSTRLDQYGKGIKITEDNWDAIEEGGGRRIIPQVRNNSDETVFYKPEGERGGEDQNPGYSVNGAYPIAPNTDLYVEVDGVNTSAVDGEVYKSPDRLMIIIDSDGNPDIDGILESMVPGIGNRDAPDPGWHALRDAIKK